MEPILSLQIPYFYIVHVAIVSIRVGAALMFAPIWGYPGIPQTMRILLVFSMAFGVATVTPFNPDAYRYPAVVIPAEFLIGLLLSMGVRIAFAGLHLAGQLLGFHLGFGAVQTIDPHTSNRSTLMSTFLTLCGYVLLLSTDQHHLLIRSISESYSILPVGSMVASRQWFEPVMTSASQIFILGWKISLPVFIATLLVELGVAFVARMQPQINTMVVSAPLKLLLGLFVLGSGLMLLPVAIGEFFNTTMIRR